MRMAPGSATSFTIQVSQNNPGARLEQGPRTGSPQTRHRKTWPLIAIATLQHWFRCHIALPDDTVWNQWKIGP